VTDTRVDQPVHLVIGSGPAGVACAHALTQRGARVRLLDAGLSLEASRVELVSGLRSTSPASWSKDQIARLKEGTLSSAKGIPLKLAYGSDFPYRECDEHLRVSYEGVAVRPSLATGGLSNVWGAAMMPYRQADIADWPIGVAQLAEHYSAAAAVTGLSAVRDDLEQLFPIYAPRATALSLSRQAATLLDRLQRRQSEFANVGVHFGQARVAVRAPGSMRSEGCVYCGLCMYGCPYGHIYSSETTLRRLQHEPTFVYEPGIVVTRLQESAGGVTVQGYRRAEHTDFIAAADRVYLAAGTIPTTQILLRSRDLYDHTVRMKDSQYFLFPLLLGRSTRDVANESLHTLSQLFVEILDPGISPYTVHLQLYSYNDLIGRTVRAALGPLARPLEFLARNLEGRLIIAQGYLHSEHSANIAMTLRKGTPDHLELRAEPRAETNVIIRRVLRKLIRLSRHIGGLPLTPMLQIAEPGRGFHTGGTFPMRSHPTPMETDTLGRPFGWNRVHVVDSTSLPSIPATTITFSVMANAHRIGSLAAALS
jgi:choline dehydrogenase-like flavoprotein